VYLQALYSALPPAALLRAIYPVLSSYKTPDEEVRLPWGTAAEISQRRILSKESWERVTSPKEL
jgi:hypothetical protein